jgi:membrane fusion protein (multidrug efflux system)
MPVEVAEVRAQTIRQQFRALGSIEADETIEVTSEQSGVVKRMPFTEGSWVGAGALLARFDDREAKAAAERAAAQREQAESSARRAETLAEQQVISRAELDDVRSALKVAQANDSEAQTRFEKTRIRAPWGGLVGRRRVSPGAYVRPGDVITEIARVTSVKVRFAAPERYVTELKAGVPVDITTPAYPGQTFTGRLSVVDPIIDAQTRTVQLTALVPNPDRALKPGMSANVAVTVAERPGALLVPDEALFAEGEQNFVYVVKPDSTVTRAPVGLGVRDSSRVEIVSGLVAGQSVVSAGHQKIFDGAKVMPIPAGMMTGGAPGPGGPGAAGGGGAGAAEPAVAADSGQRGVTGGKGQGAAKGEGTVKGRGARGGKP